MPLKRKQYAVALTTDQGIVEHVVDVGPGDQLRAELEGGKRGLLSRGGIEANPLAFSALCVYFACVRAELYAGDFNTFIHTDCYEYDPVRDDAGEAVDEPVDPTPSAGPSPSGSPSQPGSPAPPTGSTPGSTSGS